MRAALATGLVLALVTASSAVFSFHLSPLGLSAAHPAVAGAHTQILVDGPVPSALSTQDGGASFPLLDNGAQLLSGFVVNPPVTESIASAIGVPVNDISFSDPTTPLLDPSGGLPPSNGRRYSVAIAARPDTPILDVYTQAPTAATALKLTDAVFTGLSRFMATAGTGGDYQLSINQFGHGRVIYSSAYPRARDILTRFLLSFAIWCMLCLWLGRIRRARLAPDQVLTL
jgi:hypothetical protein